MKILVKLLFMAVFVVSTLAVPVAKPILGFGGGFSGSNGKILSVNYQKKTLNEE